MEKAAYLPLSSGLLRAYAETSEQIRENYVFMPFLFHRDIIENILCKYDNPSVAAFSTAMWNEQLNLKVAAEVKKRYPECLIVFGGPSVPFDANKYFEEHPFIDITVRGDGEEAFLDILTRFLEGSDFSGIPGISWRDRSSGLGVKNIEERELSKDLDRYPSPYLKGLFENLFIEYGDMSFQAIIETNRGCPFHCVYCYWGQGGLSRKYRFHSIERVAAELEWCARHKIIYVFNADSNFGIHNRDWDIANILVEIKKRYGYPERFRTCFTKNTDEKIYKIAMLLHENGLEKGITLSRQTNEPIALANIKRQNIKISTYENLQGLFNKANIPVYTELILGLPGESYDSLKKGIDGILHSGLMNQLFIYQCQVYPNTELADREYQRRYAIVTKRIVLTEIHAAFRDENSIPEYEDIIVSTYSMPIDEWRKMILYSWVVMLFHGLKAGFFLLLYLADRFPIRFSEFFEFILSKRALTTIIGQEILACEQLMDEILDGKERGVKLHEFGKIYWDVEEAMFLRISKNITKFYLEMEILTREFLKKMAIEFDEDELKEALCYQEMLIPTVNLRETTRKFEYNLPEYFEKRKNGINISIKKEPQMLKISPRDFFGNKIDYAREIILWGRKSGKILMNAEWEKA